MNDLIVVVPGIMGSRLVRRDGLVEEEVWGTGLARLAAHLLTFGRGLKQLEIGPDADPDSPGDGLVPGGVVTDLSLIPGLGGVTGYDGLVRDLLGVDGVTAGQVRSFSYDWRLSCRVNGGLFASFLDEQVGLWRCRSGFSDAQAVVVAHSMGGLVARWAVEVGGVGELVSRLVTFGTPFRGAAKALDVLANGLRMPTRVGPSFDSVVQSLPAVRELLPTNNCVRVGADMVSVAAAGVLDPDWVEGGARFHRELALTVGERAGGLVPVTAVVGSRQDTLSSAVKHPWGKVEVFKTIDGTQAGTNAGGDGTVPAGSATPPEWSEDVIDTAVPVADRHSSIHASEAAMAVLGWKVFREPRPKGGVVELGLDIPDLVPAGVGFDVAVIAGTQGLNLGARVAPVYGAGDEVRVQLRWLRTEQVYRAKVDGVGPGVYTISVGPHDQTRSSPVASVSDVVVSFEEN